MSEIRRLRITSNGSLSGTKVIDVATGKTPPVVAIDWHAEWNPYEDAIPIAKVEVLFTELDVETNAEVIAVCPECRREPGAYNVNDEVGLRLNDRGRALYRQYYAETWIAGHRVEPEADADGFTRMPLWECMAIFGQHISVAQEPPFETAISLRRMP